ncbi:hypothetical protein HGRIS_011761 [Hohenbuehelia grisea]|uniref:Tim44-like domain-containing protein n=1 Tax=Hohenbuehelia grisea TaxID=104357 RepID=A0ABR3JWW6_9AGAR
MAALCVELGLARRGASALRSKVVFGHGSSIDRLVTAPRFYSTASTTTHTHDHPGKRTAGKFPNSSKSNLKLRPELSEVPPSHSTSKPRPTPMAKGAAKQAAHKPPPSPEPASGSSTGPPDDQLMSEQLAQLDQMINMGKMFPTLDPWAHQVDTLDVDIPYKINPLRPTDYESLSDMWHQFKANSQNSLKSALSMWSLASYNAFPGFDLSRVPRGQRFLKWPWLASKCRSLKHDDWIAPIRAATLDAYQEFNEALAQNDIKKVKRFTTASYQETQLKVLRRRDASHIYKWRFYREVTPTRVLSIRATEGYLAPEEPRFGNRMLVHALVRFDSEQSIEIYDSRGKALHTPHPRLDQSKMTKLNVPAESHRVTEYLVLEKRMWLDGPWMIRDQLWPRAGKKAIVAA